MAVYKLHVKWKDKEITLKAKSLDMTHPYFISIKDIIWSKASKIVVNPVENELYEEFKQTKNLMFPLQSIILIEELYEKDETPFKPIVDEKD
ncbi:MAG: DUF1820 family protein [Spirochaetes bacterium]|nr:DUF1820 family protein [Spirochaetota bacterium]